jgi:hypothetical protein
MTTVEAPKAVVLGPRVWPLSGSDVKKHYREISVRAPMHLRQLRKH